MIPGTTEIPNSSEHPDVEDPSTVSVVIPCYDEERFIGKALEQLAVQFDHDRYEIIVVDGMSDDRTREVIAEFSQQHPTLSVLIVDNPAQNIPTALNLGIRAAKGEIIVRMDAHAAPSPGYVRRLFEVLRTNSENVVGMPCRVLPGTDSLMAAAIAAGVSHPFGIGDAKYRLGKDGPAQEAVDTVAFASFHKSLWKALGGFNEELLANEDYDFNYRVRMSGSEVILDRAGYCDYFARTTIRSLAQQYLRYGSWKAEMVRLQPRSIKLRHLVAPLFVLSLVALGLAGLRWRLFWGVLGFELVVYSFLSLVAGFQVAIRMRRPIVVLLMPIVFATIHICWGSSFILRLIGVTK